MNVPLLARNRLIPIAKLNTLPLYHFAIATVIATINDSEPTPNKNLPASIKCNPEEKATMNPEIVQIEAKRIADFFVPIYRQMPPKTNESSAAKL